MATNTDNSRLQAPHAEAAGGAVRIWQLLALASAAYLALGLLAGPRAFARLTAGPGVIAAAVLAGIAYILIALALVALVSRLPLSWKGQLGTGLLFAVAFGAARLADMRLPGQPFQLVGDLLLVLMAVFLGIAASRIIRERNMLVPVAVVAAAIDTWGVYWGFVAEVGKKAPEVVQQFSAAVPGSAAAGLPVPLLSSVGIGDFLFMGLFVGAVYRLHMNPRATLWALFAVYLLVPPAFAAVSAVTGSAAPLLPGLLFLSFAVLIANWRQFHFSRAERYALLYAGAVVAAIILLAWGVKRMLSG